MPLREELENVRGSEEGSFDFRLFLVFSRSLARVQPKWKSEDSRGSCLTIRLICDRVVSILHV